MAKSRAMKPLSYVNMSGETDKHTHTHTEQKPDTCTNTEVRARTMDVKEASTVYTHTHTDSHSHQLLSIMQMPLRKRACQLVTGAVTGMNLLHSSHRDSSSQWFALDRTLLGIGMVQKTATVATAVCDSAVQ